MTQQFADACARLRPHLRSERHEGIQRRPCKNSANLVATDQTGGFQHGEIENLIADRHADAQLRLLRRDEYPVRQVLDRKVGCRIDVKEGAQLGIVRVHFFIRIALAY